VFGPVLWTGRLQRLHRKMSTGYHRSALLSETIVDEPAEIRGKERDRIEDRDRRS